VQSGKFAVGSDDTRFHVLGLAPNAARIAMRFWETATAAELAEAHQRPFRRHRRGAHADYEPEHLSLFRLLTGLALCNKADNIPPNLGGEVMRAILEDLPYPATLLNAGRAALPRRTKGDLRPRRRHQGLPQPRHPPPPIYQSGKEFLPMLDPANPTRPTASAAVRRRWKKSRKRPAPASTPPSATATTARRPATPVAVFTTLLRLKNHHLGKLNPGRACRWKS
jgi:CRISPR-associated protein Csd1